MAVADPGLFTATPDGFALGDVADPGLFTAAPDGFSLGDVTVRLARPDERGRWDEQVDLHHYLGFKRFAGRGLRYVVEWRERWLALAGWQSGAFKSRHRDRWVGWSGELSYRRLHLIANNTRFVILSPPGVFPHLGSWALARMTRRLSADWQAQYGHPLLVAESFVDPGRFAGTCYRAANWQFLGRTRGYARHNGRYTQPHGRPKRLYVHPLRRDARERLRDPGPLPAAWEPKGPTAQAPARLRSLYGELAAVPDFRRAQGRKHTVASVLAVYILARLANCRGPVAAAEYARQLSQAELKAVGAWKSPRTGRYVPVSKSTLHRVIGSVDPEQVEAVLRRFAMPRLALGQAIAIDGKRIRGANRHAATRYETATLVAHDTGLPVATLGFHEEGGETAAVRALLEQVPLAGRLLTVDALYTTRETARLIVDIHAADYLMTVKKNAPETHRLLSTIDWERDATGHFRERVQKAHGRIEQRAIAVLTPPRRLLNYPHAAQVFRITRRRTDARQGRDGATTTEHVYGFTSVPAERATPRQLLAWNRGHWVVEVNHHIRDTTFAEDACLARTRFAPVNATCTNIALAIILHRTRFDSVAAATRHFARRPRAALDALLQP